MRTEDEIKERIQRLLDLRIEIVRLTGKENKFHGSIASIDGAVAQLRWVIKQEDTDGEKTL